MATPTSPVQRLFADLMRRNVFRVATVYGGGQPIADAGPAASNADVLRTAYADLSSDARPAIAVLPFADMSEAGDQEYFTDGITEELLNALAKIRALRVAGRTSSFAYKGQDRDLREIGAELGVRYIMEGSVRKQKDQLRINHSQDETERDARRQHWKHIGVWVWHGRIKPPGYRMNHSNARNGHSYCDHKIG